MTNRTHVLSLLAYIPNRSQAAVANFNAPQNLYWLDIPVAKLDQFDDVYLCLVRDFRLRVFKVPTDHLRTGFLIRQKAQVVQLEIDGDTFRDTRGPAGKPFEPFLYEERNIA